MNQYVEKFLEEVLDEVKCKEMHAHLAYEINDHIQFLKERFIEEGDDEDTAYEEAIKQMGEASIVGKELHKAHKPKVEWTILVLMLGLIGVGIFTLAMYQLQSGVSGNLEKHIISICVGIVIFFLMYFIDYRTLEKWSFLMYGIGVILMLIPVISSMNMNGSTRYIQLGEIYIQPANVTVPLFIISTIGFVRRWANDGIKGYITLFGLTLIPTVLCMNNQAIKGFTVGAVCLSVFIEYIHTTSFKGNKKTIINLLIASTLTFVVAMSYFLLSTPSRLTQINVWLHPFTEPTGAGYLPNNIRSVLKGANWIGNDGLMGAKEQAIDILYANAGMTDFTFNFIMGNMGILMGVAIVILITILMGKCFKTVTKIRDEYGRSIFLAYSIFFTITFLANIFVNMGMPLISCHLPFLSLGGTNMISDMAALGIMLGVYRRKNIIPYELSRQKALIEIRK